jgi:hypothetical protein
MLLLGLSMKIHFMKCIKIMQNILLGFARLGGRSIGIVANQPLYLAGVRCK